MTKKRSKQMPTKSRESLETTLKNLYPNKLENIEEIDKYLDTCDHLKLIQEDINHLNRSITSKEIEAAIVAQKRKIQDLTDSQLNSNRPLKKN
jgi:hypothetical protein